MTKESAKTSEIRVKLTQGAYSIRKIEMLPVGMKLTYSFIEARNGIGSRVERAEKHKRPVQKELRQYFDLLKEHLLKVTGYHWGSNEAMEMLKASTTVKGVIDDRGTNKFQLNGTRTVDETIVNISSALREDDGYEDYSHFAEIILNIRKEITLFMNGKGADSRLVVIDYLKHKKDMPDAENEFEKMTKEEQDKLMMEACECFGLEIIEENGEMVIGVGETTTTVEDEET